MPVPINRPLRILPLALALLLVLSACDQAAELIPGVDEPEVHEADFQLGGARSVDPHERPDSDQKARDEAPKIVALINSFYSAAFLDPDKWQAGQHPDLAGLFTAEAQPGLAANLNSLAMADLAERIDSIAPQEQNLAGVTFYVDDDGALPIGVATVAFAATAQPSGGGDEVQIRHAAHYWLQREGDAYKISAFSTALTADDGAAP